MYTKKWWQSKTIWGGIVAVGSAIAGGLFELYIDEATQTQIIDLALVVAGGLGGLLAIIGRYVADKDIE